MESERSGGKSDQRGESEEKGPAVGIHDVGKGGRGIPLSSGWRNRVSLLNRGGWDGKQIFAGTAELRRKGTKGGGVGKIGKALQPGFNEPKANGSGGLARQLERPLGDALKANLQSLWIYPVCWQRVYKIPDRL